MSSPPPAASATNGWVIKPRAGSRKIWQTIRGTVLLFGLAMAARQSFSATPFTLVSDITPNAVSGAVGLGGCVSSILGGVPPSTMGWILGITVTRYLLPRRLVLATAAIYLL